MKALFTAAILILFSSVIMQAQDAPPKAPSNMGNSTFDTFKTNCFGILDQSVKTDADITHMDTEVKTYSGAMASANVEKLKKDYTAIMDLSKTKKNLVDRIGKLDDEGKAVLQSAKDFKPAMKAPAAVSNVNKSISALDYSRKKLTTSGALLKDDAALLNKELKARGEKVEDFVE